MSMSETESEQEKWDGLHGVQNEWVRDQTRA